MPPLLKDVTIEEIANLIKSLNPPDMDELVNTWLDDRTKKMLKRRL